MSSFRMVVLDYAKNQLENSLAQKVLADLIVVKQKNFERTDPNYVVMDKHDMIGTHILIYNTENIFNPQLIFALRMTYEDRSEKHYIKTPIQDVSTYFGLESKSAYKDFCGRHPTLVDCNSWFVDPEYSLKNSGLRLSDIGYLFMYLQIQRRGADHVIGCTNEKYKAHRWLDKIGYFDKSHYFKHPVVDDPHMLIMIEKFNVEYLSHVYEQYKNVVQNAIDIRLPNESLPHFYQLAETCFGKLHQNDTKEQNLSALELKKAA
jgi:hypothetical protein